VNLKIWKTTYKILKTATSIRRSRAYFLYSVDQQC